MTDDELTIIAIKGINRVANTVAHEGMAAGAFSSVLVRAAIDLSMKTQNITLEEAVQEIITALSERAPTMQ
jgi:hypothetical protein